jgi:hypothetical protein
LWEGSSFTVYDTYSYTPQPPAFITGDLDGEGANPLVRGFLVGRVDTEINNMGAAATIPLARQLSVTGSYSNGLMRFGTSEFQQTGAGSLTSTQYTSYGGGLVTRLSQQDTVSVNYLDTQYNQGISNYFTTRAGYLGWNRTFSPVLAMKSTAGVQLIEGAANRVKIPASIGPVGSFLLSYRDQATAVSFYYNISITPSYQLDSQVLLSNVVSLSLVQQMPVQDLQGMLSVNYGWSERYIRGSGSPISFNSYAGVAGLTYRVTRKTFLSLSYSLSNFDQTFGPQRYIIDRQVVQLSLSQALY